MINLKKFYKSCIHPLAFWIKKLPCGFIFPSHPLQLKVAVWEAHFHYRCCMCIKGECLWRKLHFRCAPCGVHLLSKPISDKTCYLSYFSVVKNLVQNCCSWAIVCKFWGAQDLVCELKLQQCWVKVWDPVRTLQITNTATWNFSNLMHYSLEMYL